MYKINEALIGLGYDLANDCLLVDRNDGNGIFLDAWNTDKPFPSEEELKKGQSVYDQMIHLASMPDLSQKQFKLALAFNGLGEEDIQKAISSIEDRTDRLSVLYEWNYSNSFQRSNPQIILLATLLGYSEEQFDDLWQQAMIL